jgi:hypothetical protein
MINKKSDKNLLSYTVNNHSWQFPQNDAFFKIRNLNFFLRQPFQYYLLVGPVIFYINIVQTRTFKSFAQRLLMN